MGLPLQGPGIVVTHDISSDKISRMIIAESIDADTPPDHPARNPETLCGIFCVRISKP